MRKPFGVQKDKETYQRVQELKNVRIGAKIQDF